MKISCLFIDFNYFSVLHTIWIPNQKEKPTRYCLSYFLTSSLTSKQSNKPSKMFSANRELPQKSLPMKQDDKFSRVLSKESSMANPSFKVYYGGLPGNVPFMWESQPGTPKHKFSEETLPPLNPPPSYYSKNLTKKPFKKHTRSNLLRTLFLKISLNKKNHLPQSPSSTSSSSSWLFSKSDLSMRVPMKSCGSRFSSPCSSFDFRGDYEEEGVVGSPTSTLCFGFRRVSSAADRPGFTCC